MASRKPAQRRQTQPKAAGRDAERSLSRPLQQALDRDIFEDDHASRGGVRKRMLDDDEEDESGSEFGGLAGSDEEITSDEEGEEFGGRRQRDEDDLESLGSSVDPDEVTDLSRMLSDDEDGATAGKKSGRDANANAGMLEAIGLRPGQSRHGRERTEGFEESELSMPSAPHLSVDDLLGSLGEGHGFGDLKRDLQGAAKQGARRSAHTQLVAPVEPTTKRRMERQAAAEAAHREVSGWEQAVHRQTTAETLSFPQERQPSYGNTLGSLAANTTKNALEQGVDELLEEHGLSERAAAEAELEALRALDQSSRMTPEEAAKRMAEMKKMRDLLFYHEVKAKRIAKIKSRAYRKVHKKASKAREEQEETLGQLDKQTAVRLQMKREVERVRERMTLKHKNTSRWAKHALKQQKHNPHIAQAVQEQIAKGEELRRKQMDATAVSGSEDDSDFDSDDESSGDEDAEGGPSRDDKLLWRLQNEPDPEVPESGVFGMAFMKRAAERQQREAQQMLAELQQGADDTKAAGRKRPADGDESDGAAPSDEEEASASARKPRAKPSAAKSGRRKLAHAEAATAAADEAAEAPVGEEEEEGGELALTAGQLRSSRASGPITVSAELPSAVRGAAAAPAKKGKKAQRLAAAEMAGGSAPPKAARVVGTAARASASHDFAGYVGVNPTLTAPLIAPRLSTLHEAKAKGVNPVQGAAPGAGKRRAKPRAGRGLGAAAAELEAEAEADMGSGGLISGSSLLLPSAAQQALVEAAFPESAATEFASEKQELVEAEAGVGGEVTLPGWGDWSGMGARVGRRQQERQRSAAEARADQLAQAAARRKDAALSHVIVSEKRDKKAAKFTVAGVPFPFKTREQFERSMRNPLGMEWNTTQTHAALVQPRISTVRGAVIDPIAERKRLDSGGVRRGRRA